MMVPSWLQSLISQWTYIQNSLWAQLAQFRTWATSALQHLSSVSVSHSADQVITWSVQWIPLPIRLGILLTVLVFIVTTLEKAVSWILQRRYHPSFLNSLGHRIGGWWT